MKTKDSLTGKNDLETYGFPLPRYSTSEKAAKTYISGDKFDPVQTLFRYDPQALNMLAEEQFKSHPTNDGEYFEKPHNETSPVYEGFPDRRGVTGLARTWNHTVQRGLGNEKGECLFDIRDHNKRFKKPLEAKLSREEAIALRKYFALPSEPIRVSTVSIDGWSGSPNPGRKITISRTTGGGEQIMNNPKYSKFEKP